MKKIIYVCVTLLLIIGCSEKKSEEVQYEELRSSIKYGLYTKASKSGVSIVYEQLKEEMGDEFPDDISINDAHIGLAFLWVTSIKADFAIAESHLTLKEKSINEDDCYLLNSILALGLYENGWQKLGNEHSKKIQNSIKDPNVREEYIEKQLIYYLASGLLSLKNGDFKTAHVAFSAVGTLTGNPVFSDITKPLFQISEGEIQEGMKNLKALQTNPNISEEGRQFVGDLVINMEKKYGDITSNKFLLNVLVGAIFTEIVSNKESVMSKLYQKLNGYKEKIDF